MKLHPHGTDRRWRFYGVEGWRHRPWWKVAINTVLRALQRGPDKFVIATVCINESPQVVTVGGGFIGASIDVGDVMMFSAPGKPSYHAGVIGKHGNEVTVIPEPTTVRYRFQRVSMR